jgi:predicted nucleotidyltransferase component of viral defense system
MILESNHSKEAIQEITKTQFKGKDPQLVEKILMALTLLELLAQEKTDFVFKGGTCLLLLLKTPRRFSIDLDLIVSKRDNLLATLTKICDGSKFFTRLEEDVRVESKSPLQNFLSEFCFRERELRSH